MATPPGTKGGSIPYLDGPLEMKQRVFNVARDIVEHPQPPGHTLPPEIYMACLVIEYVMRKLTNQQKGHPPGAHFVCPECRVDTENVPQLDAIRCPKCRRTATESAIQGMFHPGVYHAPGHNNVKTRDPDNYEPQLTSPIPRDLDIEKLKTIQETATEEEKPVVMYRAWKLHINQSEDGKSVPTMGRLLQSVNNATWEPRHPLRAVHYPNGHRHQGEIENVVKGGCPNWHCQCGIYGVKTLAQAQKWSKVSKPGGTRPNSHIQVLGKVVMWGKVLQYEVGSKAEYAYPERLWISPTQLDWAGEEHPDRLAEELSAKYGIPVDLEDGMYDLGLSHT